MRPPTTLTPRIDAATGSHRCLDARRNLRKAQFGNRLQETRFLDHLSGKGLCSPTQRKALGSWPDGMTLRPRHEFGEVLVLRRVNHIKLVYRPGYPLEVKAYLCAGFGALANDYKEGNVARYAAGRFRQ